MATDKGRGVYAITVEPYELKNLIQTLNMLPKESQDAVRDAAQPLSKRLAGQLMMSAMTSPTPQARLVAQSILTPRDRLIRVDIGGKKKVGRKYGGTMSKNGKSRVRQDAAPAGALLWGSEYGSHSGEDDFVSKKTGNRMPRKYTNRFKAPANKMGYWIRPAVDGYTPIIAKEYISIVQGVINDLGLK